MGLGDFVYDAPGINWEGIINRGIDVVGGVFGRGNYVSPDDPRYQRGADGRFYANARPGASVTADTDAYRNPRVTATIDNRTIQMIAIAGGALLIGLLLSGKRGR
jgi:hypothetical protein